MIFLDAVRSMAQRYSMDGEIKPSSDGSSDIDKTETKSQEKTILFNLILDFWANPLDQRTNKEFCAELGISEMTYYRFTKANLEGLNRSITARRETFIPKMTSVAYQHLSKRLGRSDAALKLFFQLTGQLVERTESKYTLMSPEEKREKIKQMLEILGKKLES